MGGLEWVNISTAGSIPRSASVFCGGENVCVHSLCMQGVGVRTALLALRASLKGSNCVGELVKSSL